MTLYISLVYGILYLSFFAIPYSFETDRHWSPTISSLPFLGIMTGVSIASPAVFVYSDRYYQPRLIARGHVLPEDRLPPMMVGSVILPAGLFWFAWTSSSSIHWAAQVIPTTFIGAGIMLIFTCGIAFIVDIVRSAPFKSSAESTNRIDSDPPLSPLPSLAPTFHSRPGAPRHSTCSKLILKIQTVPNSIRLRPCGQHLRPKHQRRSVPPLRPNHVPQPRHNMGHQRARVHLRIVDPSAGDLLHLWRQVEG